MRADLVAEAFSWLVFAWELMLLAVAGWIGLCLLGPERCLRIADALFAPRRRTTIDRPLIHQTLDPTKEARRG